MARAIAARWAQHVHNHRQAVHQVELLEHKTNVGPCRANVGRDFALALNRLAVDFNQARVGAVARHQAGHVPQQR